MMSTVEKLAFQLAKLRYVPDDHRVSLYAGPDDIVPDHRQLTVGEFKELLSAVGVSEQRRRGP